MRKRHILSLVVLAALSACSDGVREPAASTGALAPGWAEPPRITRVVRQGAGLVVSGQAGRGARVVLRGADAAFAAAADDQGRFEIHMPAPTGDVLLTPEVQTGQDAGPAPERLMIVAGGAGPIALLAPGTAARRLDAAPALASVDSDGRVLAVSGRAPAGQTVSVGLAGRDPVTVVAGPDGRWTAMPGPASATRIMVGNRAFDWPGEGGAALNGAPMAAERAGAGWRATWTVSPTSRQVSWFPDRTP